MKTRVQRSKLTRWQSWLLHSSLCKFPSTIAVIYLESRLSWGWIKIVSSSQRFCCRRAWCMWLACRFSSRWPRPCDTSSSTSQRSRRRCLHISRVSGREWNFSTCSDPRYRTASAYQGLWPSQLRSSLCFWPLSTVWMYISSSSVKMWTSRTRWVLEALMTCSSSSSFSSFSHSCTQLTSSKLTIEMASTVDTAWNMECSKVSLDNP